MSCDDSVFIRACRREETPYTPVWIMRQAGRYLADYREIRTKNSFRDLCRNPELCAQVTVSARDTLKADAAIIFSDILLLFEPFGFIVEYPESGGGPRVTAKSGADLPWQAMGAVGPEGGLDYVYEAVRCARKYLDPSIPLIGFAGAPFTLASYLLEGMSPGAMPRTRALLRESSLWHSLMEKLSSAVIRHLTEQIRAGADAVQIFDTWVGALGPAEFETLVLPYVARVISSVHGRVPVIYYGTGMERFLPMIANACPDVVGIDHTVSLDTAWNLIGGTAAIQGNLDPEILFQEPETIKVEVGQILAKAGGRPGHIFNLGRGILPGTPEDHAIGLVEWVHEMSLRTPDGGQEHSCP